MAYIISCCLLQVCVLTLSPRNYFPSEVTLVATNQEAQTNYFTEHGEWTFQFGRVQIYRNQYADNIVLALGFRRESSFLLVNVLLPILLMATMNLLVFIIPPDAGERISYSVTVLLALAVYLTIVGDNLPKTSRPMPIFCYYLTAVVILSVSMCFVTIINLRIYHKDETTEPPACLQSFVNVLTCRFHRNRRRKSSVKTNGRAYICRENGIPKGSDIMTASVQSSPQSKSTASWKELSHVLDVVFLVMFVLVTLAANLYYITKLQSYTFVEPDFGLPSEP